MIRDCTSRTWHHGRRVVVDIYQQERICYTQLSMASYPKQWFPDRYSRTTRNKRGQANQRRTSGKSRGSSHRTGAFADGGCPACASRMPFLQSWLQTDAAGYIIWAAGPRTETAKITAARQRWAGR